LKGIAQRNQETYWLPIAKFHDKMDQNSHILRPTA